MNTSMQLGIDFGTTRTVVAIADRGNYPVVDFVDHHGDAASAIPSMVAARDGELRFGFDAVAVAGDPTFTVLRSFKRLFSNPTAGPEQRIRIGDTTVTLGAVLTGFFEHVRDAIVKRSSSARTRTLHAAVAVPANALGNQRLTTLDAFRRAGFDAFAILNEPSAHIKVMNSCSSRQASKKSRQAATQRAKAPRRQDLFKFSSLVLPYSLGLR